MRTTPAFSTHIAILIAVAFHFCGPAWGQSMASWKRQRLNIEQGLSDNNVSHVFRDSRGFVWIATQYGVNRYDGYEFRYFTYDPAIPGSLTANWVFSTAEDRQGYLWMGTYGGGLCRFDPRSETFKAFRAGQGGLNDDHVTCALQDQEGILWIGTINGGLNRYDPLKNTFSAYPAPADWMTRAERRLPMPEGNHFKGSPCPHIICLLEEDENRLWVGTFSGLALFDKTRQRFTYFFHDPADPNSLPENFIAGLHRGSDGRLWVETRAGWAVYRPKQGDFERRPNPEAPPATGPGAKWRDKDGSWWVATSQGVDIWRRSSNPFALGRDSRYPAAALDFPKARTMLEAGNWLWIGSEDGLFRCRLNDPQAKMERFLPNAIFDLQPGPGRTIWATSLLDGLFQIDWADGTVKSFIPQPEGFRPASWEIFTIVPDSWGYWWVGGRDCLDRYDPRTGRFESFAKGEKTGGRGLSDPYVFCLSYDRNRGLWIGTSDGGLNLLRFDQSGRPNGFDYFSHQEGKSGSLSSNIVLSLHLDRQDRLWVGTDGGLNVLDSHWRPGQEARFKTYLRRDGLGDDKIMSICDDEQGRIWVGLLSHGLACLAGDSIRHFSRSDGLPGHSFYLSASWQRSDGLMFFGSTEGMAVFHPDQVQPRRAAPPPVYFTDVQLFHRPLSIGKQGPSLPVSPLFSPNLNFRYHENELSFRFAALTVEQAERNQYAYRLLPADTRWHYLGTRRELTFSKLAPGRYTLQVKGADHAGNWNEAGASLQFRIRPPWWQTIWAYLFFSLVALAFIAGLFRFQLRRQLERREAGRLRELDALKTRLFANITHEFRTPLTLILGPLRKWRQTDGQKEVADLKEESLELMERNAERLLTLVNQLLDMNKLEAGLMQAQWSRVEINGLLEEILAPFRPQADLQEVALHFYPLDPPLSADCDVDKLAKIVGNLLSNALKATPAGGQIKLSAFQKGQEWSVVVEDNGRGIAEAHLPYLFDRFYQVTEAGDWPVGSGIGLALANELAILLGGALECRSTLGQGSRFTLSLPLSMQAPATESTPLLPVPAETSLPPMLSSWPAEDAETGRPLVMVVEDNADMARYLAACLQAEYQLHFAANGREGWEKALEEIPDLIVSDVMMPEMDGYSLCRLVKNDFRTSHIPLILLTAKTDLPARLEGYEQGADAYLGKPFHEAELLAVSRNLIRLRRRLWEKFAPAGRPADQAEELPPAERAFWEKWHALLLKHLDDEHFSVEKMARELTMSRTQLHRKAMALTGHSAGRLLQNLRMERARQLLRSSDLSIGEVAFQCGFSDPNYFTRLFVKTQGCTPSEFRSGLFPDKQS